MCSVLVLQHGNTFVRIVEIHFFISMIALFLTPLNIYKDTALRNRLVKALLDADGIPSPSLYPTPDIQLRRREKKVEKGFNGVFFPLTCKDHLILQNTTAPCCFKKDKIVL